jgi:flagellar biosynthetic protein FliP
MNIQLVAAMVLSLLVPLAGARVIGPVVDEPARSPMPAPGPVMSIPGPGQGGVSAMNPLEVLGAAGDAVSRSGGAASGGGLSVAINIMMVLTVISLAPSIILMTTCFMRILIVLGVVKQALGAGSVPPPQVITALSLFTTFVVMAPTIDRINAEAVAPYRAGEVRDYDELWKRARQPMRDFMFDQIDATGNWSSVYMILSRRGVDVSEPEKLTREDVDMLTLVPAYMLSELKVAFLLGFKVYLPFLVIDMVVSTMLISMGMMMLPPVMVSLPFKILLFVLVDGWTLVVGGLMRSFVQPGDLAALWPPPGPLHQMLSMVAC